MSNPTHHAPPAVVTADVNALADAFRTDYRRVQAEIGKVIVGHEKIVDGVLTCLFVGGHALLEGVPGLGKTALIRALASALSLRFNRIQFTPDLMPADVLGTNVIDETPDGRREFRFVTGPIFAQIVLADEINRATPKTQSAMLEAMQERQVTAGGEIRPLEPPFFVMATQNPIEQEGTYPLPEAQLDRFFYKLVVEYSGREEMHEILNRTTMGNNAVIEPVIDAARIISHQALARRVVIAPHVQDYAVRCVLATHPRSPFTVPDAARFLRYGASPRAAQTIALAAKVRALLDGRFNVSFKDIQEVVPPAMRHRIILNFEAEAEGVSPDSVLEKILAQTPERVDDVVGVK